MTFIKKTRNNKCWKECGEKRTPMQPQGKQCVNWGSCYGKQYGGSQKIKNRTI